MNAASADQRGFTVPEVLVGMALLLAIGLATLGTVRFFVQAVVARASAEGGTVALEQQLDAMRTEAATAFAVFVPLKDVFGQANVPAGVAPGDPASSYVGHEVDFYTKTDTGAETYWAYYYDAGLHTLRRYDYDSSGQRGVADRSTGAIDAAGRYPAVTGVRSFTARRFEANELATSDNAFGPLIAGFTAVIGLPDADPVGFLPASGAPRSDLYGGNTTIALAFDTEHGTRTLHLATAALPSGFTIHETPAIRALVYRINTVHRSWFGFAQKTSAHIFEQLQYSYHPKTDPPDGWKVWCDYELFGSHINGLSLSDPNVAYHPQNYLESTANVYYTVTHGGYAALDPSPQCSMRVPSPTQTFAPAPAATDPDVVDTPPPCFVAGQCWPANAPANWTPPSPWPAASPPAKWCENHQQSPLCGGAGGTPVPISGSPPPVVLQTSAPVAGATPMPGSFSNTPSGG